EPGMLSVQRLPPEPRSIQRTRLEVLHEHVRARDETRQHLASLRVLEVHRHAFLVPVDAQKVRRLRPDEGRAPLPGVVPVAGVFDLDDARAEIGEHHRAVRPGEHARQVDDGETVEWAAHRAAVSRGSAAIRARSVTIAYAVWPRSLPRCTIPISPSTSVLRYTAFSAWSSVASGSRRSSSSGSTRAVTAPPCRAAEATRRMRRPRPAASCTSVAVTSAMPLRRTS